MKKDQMNIQKREKITKIVRLFLFWIPIVMVFAFCMPIVKIKQTGTKIRMSFTGFNIIGGMFVDENYDGHNENLADSSGIKAMSDIKQIDGGRTVVCNGIVSLLFLLGIVTLLITNIYKRYAPKTKFGTKLKELLCRHEKYISWAVGIVACLFFIFSFCMAIFHTTGWKMQSYISFFGIVLFVGALLYAALKTFFEKYDEGYVPKLKRKQKNKLSDKPTTNNALPIEPKIQSIDDFPQEESTNTETSKKDDK